MKDATRATRCIASLARRIDVAFLVELWPVALRMVCLVSRFLRGEVTPQRTHDFEVMVGQLAREASRRIVQWTYNRIEQPDEVPVSLWCHHDHYRRKRKSPMRHLSCLFGTIKVHRYLFEATEVRDRSLFPLECQLGIVANSATPALADAVGRLASHLTQGQVLLCLLNQHGVSWGVRRLRNVIQAVAQGMSEHQHQAQVGQLLTWLKQAAASLGSRKFVLSVGRDGIMLPIMNNKKYREGATATLTVLSRGGKRLGTVYLAQMPEEYQQTLSDALTNLITDVLAQWKGPMPRLTYVTDAGYHPTKYFDTVLSRMRHPVTGKKLKWCRIVDYYHACQYISKIAQAIFGPGREAHAWSKKMRNWLKTKPKGLSRVLHSAGALRSIRGLIKPESEEQYQSACGYLRNHAAFMNYAHHRRHRLPIGSGITEAACKTVFTQRFKQSGMKWKIESAAHILTLRVIALSGVWDNVRTSMLANMDALYKNNIKPATSPKVDRLHHANAA